MDLRLKLHYKRLGRGGHKKRGKKKSKNKAKQKNFFVWILINHCLRQAFTYTLFTNEEHLLESYNATLGRKKRSTPSLEESFYVIFGVVFVAVTNLHICFYKVSPISENYFMLPCYYTNKMKSKFLHDVTCKPFVLKWLPEMDGKFLSWRNIQIKC